MSNVSQYLPQRLPTVDAIFDKWLAKGAKEKRRRYLGMSAIGAECERSLWYSFRHCVQEEFDGRMYRLFHRGHREEKIFTQELEAIGCEVITHDESGQQIGHVAVGGHYRGHMDAAILGVLEAQKTWHVGEFKTHSLKSFEKLMKEGVQKSKPQHYAQMQAYMMYAGMTRALYLAVNKNDDDLYAERVRYDATFAKQLEGKAERVITSTQALPKLAPRRDDFRCKFCPAIDLCHGPDLSKVAVPIQTLSCRQCCHATPVMEDGKWHCSKLDKMLTDEEQDHPCNQLLLLPGFVTFAQPVDSGSDDHGDWIEFRNDADEAVWRHGNNREAGQYSAWDLIASPAPIKEEFGSLLEKYAAGSRASAVFQCQIDAFETRWKQMFKTPVPEPVSTEDGDGVTAVEFPGNYLGLFSDTGAELRYLHSPTNPYWRELNQ